MKPRHIPTDPEILAYARNMRQPDTRADRRLLHLKFHRQFPIANYIVDFYSWNSMAFQELGYRVLRVPNGMVLQAPEDLAREIERFLIGD